MAFKLFRKTIQTEQHIHIFLMNIMEAGFLLLQGLETYMAHGSNRHFMEIKNKISFLESQNDQLRRQVELDLYHHMLLPGMRSDIIDLLEGCDKIINKYESDVILWSVEKPILPKKNHAQIQVMVQTDLECVGALIGAVQGFFAGAGVDEAIQKTYALEHQVDLQAIELKKCVFQKIKTPLAHQLQLKDFIYSLEKISDMAEDTADKLKVMIAKHTL